MSMTRTYEPPNDKQLQSFVAVMLASRAKAAGLENVSAVAGAAMVMRSPAMKAIWLQQHRDLQESAWAAADAASRKERP